MTSWVSTYIVVGIVFTLVEWDSLPSVKTMPLHKSRVNVQTNDIVTTLQGAAGGPQRKCSELEFARIDTRALIPPLERRKDVFCDVRHAVLGKEVIGID